MVEPQIVILVVAGSSPVGHPAGNSNPSNANDFGLSLIYKKSLKHYKIFIDGRDYESVISASMLTNSGSTGAVQRIYDYSKTIGGSFSSRSRFCF